MRIISEKSRRQKSKHLFLLNNIVSKIVSLIR